MAPPCWLPFHSSFREEVLEFLSRWEYLNVNTSSCLPPASRNPFSRPPGRSLFLCRDDRQLLGLLGLGRHGLCLPLFPPGQEAPAFRESGASSGEADPGSVPEQMFPCREIPPLEGPLPGEVETCRTLMGLKASVLALEPRFRRRIQNSLDYHLMVSPPLSEASGRKAAGQENLRKNAWANLTVRRAGPGDTDALYPLQMAYEMEEVILDPLRFHPQLCYQNLNRQLKEQIIYIAEDQGRPVAKAGTNARGFFWAQMGGVYTLPEYRNRGIAACLAGRLVRDLAGRKKRFCLFVKKENRPALKVYEKNGFTIAGEFRITYLGS